MLNNKDTITNRDVAQELLKRGIYEFQTGNYSNALAIINQAIEVKPNYYEALIVRATLIYPIFGNHQGVIQDCSQIIKINPHNQEAYNNRGYAFASIGGHLEAIKDYNRALIIDSNSIYSYLNRGISYAHVEEYERAISDFNSVIQLDPQNADAYNNRSLIFFFKRISKSDY
ncbi:MAG TPA: tetratricopeptide repeat protein [Coleofasciculaceae cyanobacterium]|jgi:tetratricopeptide (TPR) repeat protein